MIFITFVGIDQSGKSSIIKYLKDNLSSNYFYFTKEPRIFTSDLIKKIIVPSRLNFMFFFIDRIIHKLKLIKYRKKVILSDRSIVCGIAYGFATSKKLNLRVLYEPYIRDIIESFKYVNLI